ncbi:MAG TPA: radical SAM protein [Syntrophus sp. (in: bacteria)]|nr:radical SAM protein [Syntrophus sp. (in: bacteria)]
MKPMNNPLTKETPALRPYPAKLFVETTTRCNLQCPMCLKQRHDAEFLEGDISTDIFMALLPALPTLEVLVLNGIGEPLLHPRLDDFIGLAREKMDKNAWIGFQTNGLLIDGERAMSLVRAGVDRICLSVDAVSPATFSNIRQGGEFRNVEGAIKMLHAAKKTCNDRLEIGVEFVLRRDNIDELAETIQWAAAQGADFAIVTQLFPYHQALVSQTTYDANLDVSMSIFHEYMSRAEKEGIDIRRYYDVFMKYDKSAAEKKIIAFVESLVEDALRQGIALNLQKLFSTDHGWVEKMEKVFARARSVGTETGINLRLPEIIPKSARRCEFVEEGSIFVSWDGNVHPCYFLWHHYRCYINGVEKIVKPKVFGNLSARGILEIWNDPHFVSFRQNVLRYDYPFCFNCNFALCDYVEGGDFEQDCYINSEPCAVCLWCMDVFQCLK